MKKFNGEMIRKAHKFTRLMLKWYRNLDYRTQFGIIMSELLNGHELELLQEIAMANKIDWKEWSNYGKNRIYFSNWSGKYRCQYGFYDIDNKVYVLENKYTVQHDLYEVA